MLQAIVDSIQGDFARVLIGHEGVAVSIPLNQLPPRVHEGMVLRVKFTVDTAATVARDPKLRAKYEIE